MTFLTNLLFYSILYNICIRLYILYLKTHIRTCVIRFGFDKYTKKFRNAYEWYYITQIVAFIAAPFVMVLYAIKYPKLVILGKFGVLILGIIIGCIILFAFIGLVRYIDNKIDNKYLAMRDNYLSRR